MRKIVLFGILLFSTLSYGQLKQTKLTDEEVNILGQRTHRIYRGKSFNYEEIKKYNLEDILSYVVDFVYEGKTIATAIVGITHYIGGGSSTFYITASSVDICFNTKDLPDDIQFSLLKENEWMIEKAGGQRECICSKNSIKLFYTEDNENYRMNSLAKGKIKMILYKLE